MSIIKAFQIGCVAFLAYKVGTSSYKLGKFCGRLGGAYEVLVANGYTHEQVNMMDEGEMEDAINNLGKAA